MSIKNAITSTALTTPMANKCFGDRISADRFRDDVAMESMAKALFDKRLGDGEKIQIRFQSFYGDTAVNCVKDYLSEFKKAGSGSLFICAIPTRKEENGKIIDRLIKEMNISGLYKMADIMAVLKHQGMDSIFLTNTKPDAKTKFSPFDNDKSFVVMENITMARWHMLCSLLKRLLGKWFAEMPMTEDEMNGLAKGLQADTPDVFLSAIQKYADQLDLRGMFIREELKDFESKFEKERIVALEQEAKTLDNQMDDCEKTLLELATKKDEILATLFGYQTRDAAPEPFTMNYFLANKNMVLVKCNSSSLEFYSYGWLDNFDPEKAKATFGRDHMSSWLENNEEYGISKEDAKRLYKAIFLEDKVKIRLWSHFKLSLRGRDGESFIQVIGGTDCPPEIQNALPNPHHCYNSCIGDHRSFINQAMRRRDIVGALAQCLEATKGVNIMEAASYRYLASDLFNPFYGKVVYINATGEFMTTKDAVAYLKQHEEKKA